MDHKYRDRILRGEVAERARDLLDNEASTKGAEPGNTLGKVVSRIFASWNQLDGWLRKVDGLRRAA